MTFSYIIKPGKCLDENRTLLLQEFKDKDLHVHNFNNMDLPITMDPHKYGEVRLSNIIEEEGTSFVRYIVVNGNKTYQIDKYNQGTLNKVTILGNINLSWIDTLLDIDNSEYFKREIKKSTIYFLDGEIILRKKELPAKPFSKLQKESKLNNEFITFDIETITEDNKVKPYLINAYSSWLNINSYNNDECQLFIDFMDKLLLKLEKGSKYYIYAHNLGTFDGVLILKHLFKFGKVEPILHNGKIISIKLIVKGLTKDENITLIFKDSYLTLTSSLRNLCRAFNVESSKGHFPFLLNDIYYIGIFPKFEYWTDITYKEWELLKLSQAKIRIMIKIKTYPINDLFLSKGVLSIFIQKYWNEVYSQILKSSDQKHLMILVKVHFSDNEMGYRTLGHLRRVNFSDKDLFIDYLSERLSILNDSYTTLSVQSITFSYIIREGIATGTTSLLENNSDKCLSHHRFNNMNLPISMNPLDYGTILAQTVIDNMTRFIVTSNKRVFQIDVSLDKLVNRVTLLGGSDLKWTDTLLTGEVIMREIQKSTMYFLDGELILRKQVLSGSAFKKMKTEKEISSRFITMDLETIVKDNQLVPYLIAAYNGKEFITSYADSSMSQKALFTNFIIKLLTFFVKKSARMTVYAHNLSGFDGIFLMQHLLDFGKVKPLIYEGQIKSIELRLNVAGYVGRTIVFKDSFLLLPYSLRKLCKAFNIELSKGWFPFKLNDVFYKGVLPALKYWNITVEEYEILVKKYTGISWSFRDEAIKYCMLDCQCLYQVLRVFNEIVFNKFKINIHSSLTAPSLAMRLFKTHFMPENTIFSIHGKVEQDIRQSYSGGSVDVYVPHNKIGSFFSKAWRTLYYYDVNSLYPTVMHRGDMPIGNPIVFDGDIRAIEPQAYGFFYCKITSPDNLQQPLLQRRIETSDGVRTVAGLGSWEGWICSIEMDNAVKFGYTFKILKGYQFDKGNVFKDFVQTMYELRQEYPKGHPMNLIAKLMMNSLYGKFGMKDQLSVVEIYEIGNDADRKAFKQLVDLWGTSIQDWMILENHLVVIRDKKLDLRSDPEDEIYSFGGTDINIAIASAITAYARSFMSYFKNNPDFHLYYSDTDSAVVDRELPIELVGTALGQLKLEHVIKRAVFLAPKVYV